MKALAVLALLLIAGAWGATFVLIKDVLEKIAPEPFIFWRFMLGGLLLCLLAATRSSLGRAMLVPGLVLGALVFAGYWLQTRALMTISPSRSAFLTGLYVVMVPFCDRWIYRSRIAPAAWAATILAAIGTAFIVGGPDWAAASLADFMTIACALLFAFHVVLASHYSEEHSALGLAGVQVLFVGVLAAPPTLLAPHPQWDGYVVTVIVATAVVTTALAFIGLMWGQARLTATEAGVILAFEPVAAAVTSIVWEGETLTVGFVCGGLLIVAAMIVSQIRPRVRS